MLIHQPDHSYRKMSGTESTQDDEILDIPSTIAIEKHKRKI